jgi:hypothetical protein
MRMGGMENFSILECGVNKNKTGDVGIMNATMRRISATIVAVEKQ